MANQIKHFGVLGMRWGHRKAGGSSSGGDGPRFGIRPGVKAAASKVVNSKAFKAMVFDKDDVTGLIFKKSEVQKLKNFTSKMGTKMKDGFHRWQISSQDRDIKLMKEIAEGLKNSKSPRDQKLAKEHADAAKELERDLNSLYTPEELAKYRSKN